MAPVTEEDKKGTAKFIMGDVSLEQQEEEEVEELEEAGDQTTGTFYGWSVPAAKKKKKKKKKKKSAAGQSDQAGQSGNKATGIQQTDPPSIPISKFFVNEVYPEGQICDYNAEYLLVPDS